jgi:hypothetical protein
MNKSYRRRLLAPTLLLFGLLAGCDQAQPPSAATNGPATRVPSSGLPQAGAENENPAVELNRPGLSAKIIGNGDDALLLLEIDPTRLEPVLIGSPKKGFSARTAVQEHDFAAVIGSGFVSELNSLEPIGLLQVDGQTLSPVQVHGYTRILGINDAGMGVVHRTAYQRDLFYSALQVGPGIIEQGELDISERELKRPGYFRSFVAVCEHGWLAGVSLAPTHLHSLGQTLLTHIREQNWRCDEVVNLAGDRQAVIVLKTGDGKLLHHGDPDTYKVSLLGFRPIVD